jgi:hypothetical protein
MGITGTESIGTDLLLLYEMHDAMHRLILYQVELLEKGDVSLSHQIEH